MQTAMKTDIGHIRTVNEDRVHVKIGARGLTLAVVADGMGGHQAGDVASQVAVETIHAHLNSFVDGVLEEECATAIKEAIHMANEKVYSLASKEAQYHGMGTTIVVAMADRNWIVIGHIGDSRAYIWDGAKLRQLTEDHSLVNELLKSGQISAEEADEHPRRNVLTRALGTEPYVEMDVYRHEWAENDILLMCTDGLSSYVEQEKIESALSAEEQLEWKAERLVQAALEAGGDDNITVVLLENDYAAQ